MELVILLARLESQGPGNIVDQVCKLQIDEIFVLEHNTVCIKAAAMAAHYKPSIRHMYGMKIFKHQCQVTATNCVGFRWLISSTRILCLSISA